MGNGTALGCANPLRNIFRHREVGQSPVTPPAASPPRANAHVVPPMGAIVFRHACEMGRGLGAPAARPISLAAIGGHPAIADLKGGMLG
jgi:hypothetical protein